MRLDKYLSDMGVATRSELKKIIKKGRVRVNDITITDPSFFVDASSAVSLDGEPIEYAEYEYYILNKPAGVLSASEDKKAATVLDLFPDRKRKDLFPVGRLDRDTVGLLLITNDGALSHRLLSPKSHVDKTYFAKINGIVTDDDVASFSKGLYVDSELTALPADLEILNVSGDKSEIKITIREGKYHQIKRMFAAIGCEVTYLKRLSMGGLSLDEELKEGEYRKLTASEISSLKQS